MLANCFNSFIAKGILDETVGESLRIYVFVEKFIGIFHLIIPLK